MNLDKILGVGLIIFCLGLVLTFYGNEAFYFIVVGCGVSTIAFSIKLIEERFKDLKISFIYLSSIGALFYFSSKYLDYPFTTEIKMVMILFIGAFVLVDTYDRGFNSNVFHLFKHPFINHPILKVSVGLVLVSFFFRFQKWQTIEYVYQLIIISIGFWSYFKFLKGK